MFHKLLVPILALIAQFLILWFGNHTGKFPAQGTLLGISYSTPLVKSFLIQFKFLWLLIIINTLFSLAYSLGFGAYRNFLSLTLIWLAAGPIAAFAFNAIFLKDPVDWPMVMGAILIFAGAVSVVGHKEITALV